MNVPLHIDHERCIRCGRCVMVCPTKIFAQEKPGSPIEVHNNRCIACGHCVAVCPTDSIIHADFPDGTVHPADRKALPTPEQFLQLCRIRRSNRAFYTNKPVPEEYLQQILEAAHYAPTATNLQEVEFTVVTDPEHLQLIRNFTLKTYASTIRMLKFPVLKPLVKPFRPELYKSVIPCLEQLIHADAAGKDLILRNAPAVILIHTPIKSRFGSQDSNLAYQNASLMAETLGVTQFYTGYVCAAVQLDKRNRLARSLVGSRRSVYPCRNGVGHAAFPIPQLHRPQGDEGHPILRLRPMVRLTPRRIPK